VSVVEQVRVRQVTDAEMAQARAFRIGPISHVYVAGPLTHGDQAANVRAAMDAAEVLMDAGLYPFVPHLSWFSHLTSPRPYEEWLSYDLGWLKRCDAVLRLPGHSPGAERECSMATFLGIPVFRDVDALLEQAAVQR
jgi:hypothetical protein